MPIRKFLIPLIVLCMLLEIGFNVVFNNSIFSQAVNASGLFIVSMLIGLLTIVLFYGRTPVLKTYNAPPRKRLLPAFLWILVTVIFCCGLSQPFIKVPTIVLYSDIIPTIQVAVQRLFSGEYVYHQIDKFGYSLPLTYLPMQWLPYSVAEAFHFDYRWIAVAINLLALLWITQRNARSDYRGSMLLVALAGLNYFLLFNHEQGILTITVELMVAGYYMAFIAGIGSNSAVLKGLMIAICLMSRYSLVLWLPLWVLVEFLSGNRKQLSISLLVIFVFITAIYGIPFLSHDPGIFFRGYKYYSQAALGEWQHMNGDNRPAHLYYGHGFAWLFYSGLSNYSLADRLKSLQKVHFMLSFGSVVVMGIWYWLKRKKINYRIFLLGSFKIYLSIFLAFIQVPYAYLMITGSFVSIAILAELLRYNTDNEAQPAIVA